MFNVRNVLLAGRGLGFRSTNCESVSEVSAISVSFEEVSYETMTMFLSVLKDSVRHKEVYAIKYVHCREVLLYYHNLLFISFH